MHTLAKIALISYRATCLSIAAMMIAYAVVIFPPFLFAAIPGAVIITGFAFAI